MSGLRVITNYDCNLFCSFCYQKDHNKRIGIDTLKKILDGVSNRQYEYVTVMGGESTIHPDIEEILKLLNRYYCREKISLTTNGSASIIKYLDCMGHVGGITLSLNDQIPFSETIKMADAIDSLDICKVRINCALVDDEMVKYATQLAWRYRVTFCEDIRNDIDSNIAESIIKKFRMNRRNNYTYCDNNERIFLFKHNYDQDEDIILPSGKVTKDFNDVIDGK